MKQKLTTIQENIQEKLTTIQENTQENLNFGIKQ